MGSGASAMRHTVESREHSEEAAALWVARRHGEAWSPADEAALAAWLDAAPGNRVAYLRLTLGWQKAGRLTAFGVGIPAGVVPTVEQMQASPYFDRERRNFAEPQPAVSAERPSMRAGRGWRAVAASLLLAAILGAAWYATSREPAYRTQVGGLESVPLPDGSKVILNTDSEMRLRVTETERHIDLQRGEAFFEVAHDPARPFIVRAGDQRVIAVGTKFSVRRDADGVRVIVTEGKVRIDRIAAHGATPVAEVAAGRVAKSAGEGVLIQEKSLAEVEQSLSWRSGYLVFRETSLADAVAEFNRYNERQLVIADPDIAGLQIEGNFRATSVDLFTRLLESGFPIVVEHRGDQIILKSPNASR